MTTKTLSGLVQSFFTVALPRRGFSPQTILSYRDALKLLLRFTSEQTRLQVVRLEFTHLDDTIVAAFLDHLESGRGNLIATRNNRLAAIRSFFAFVAAEEPALAHQCQRVCSLPLKRAPCRSIPYLEPDEMQAILAAPDVSTSSGRRDHALLLFLYNTGARVQEATGVRAADLQLSRPRQVLLRGKRKKERICPLWETTARALRALLDEVGLPDLSASNVFRSEQNSPLTRFGIDYILKKHAAKAAETLPTLARKRVSPHTIRHTTAVHLLNSGVDINVIRSWLGHTDLRTTNIYAEIDLHTKRKAIESCAPPESKGGRRRPPWKRDPDLLSWLENL